MVGSSRDAKRSAIRRTGDGAGIALEYAARFQRAWLKIYYGSSHEKLADEALGKRGTVPMYAPRFKNFHFGEAYRSKFARRNFFSMQQLLRPG
jgi:hypothetical protein